MTHYEGLFERELLPWCKQIGLHYITDLNLEQVTKFRNSLNNAATVRNRKVSRLRTFFSFCRQRHWIVDNPAEYIKRSQESEPEAEYFQPEEFSKLIDAQTSSGRPSTAGRHTADLRMAGLWSNS